MKDAPSTSTKREPSCVLDHVPLSMNAILSARISPSKEYAQDLSHQKDNVLAYIAGYIDGLGHFRGPPLKIEIDDSVLQIFCRARSVLFSLKPGIEQAIH